MQIVLNQTRYLNNSIPVSMKKKKNLLTSSNYLINLFKYSSFKLKLYFMPILVHANANKQIILVQYYGKPLLGQWSFNIGLILGQDCNVV